MRERERERVIKHPTEIQDLSSSTTQHPRIKIEGKLQLWQGEKKIYDSSLRGQLASVRLDQIQNDDQHKSTQSLNGRDLLPDLGQK